MSGVKNGSDFWVHPIRFYEPEDHKAETQLCEIEIMLETLNDVMKDYLNVKKLVLFFQKLNENQFIF